MNSKSPLLSPWSLPQPVFVFGSTLLAASAVTTRWMDPALLVTILIAISIPLLLVLERLMPRRRDWLFNTTEWHQLHHSCNYAESNTNYGCAVILWDRLFGTFSGKDHIEGVGNGTGKQLSLFTQLTMPFRSNKYLREL